MSKLEAFALRIYFRHLFLPTHVRRRIAMGCASSKEKKAFHAEKYGSKAADEETKSELMSVSVNPTPQRGRPEASSPGSSSKNKRTPKRDAPSRQNSGSGAFSKVGKNAPTEKPWKKAPPRERTISLDDATPAKAKVRAVNAKDQEKEAARAKVSADYAKRRASGSTATKPAPPDMLTRYESTEAAPKPLAVLSPTAKARAAKLGLAADDPKAQRFALTAREEADQCGGRAMTHAVLQEAQVDWAGRVKVDAEGRTVATVPVEFRFSTDDLHDKKPQREKGDARERTEAEAAAAAKLHMRAQASEDLVKQRERFEARQAQGLLATQPQEFTFATASRARPSQLAPHDYGESDVVSPSAQKAASANMRADGAAVGAREADAYAKRMGRANPKSPAAAWDNAKTPKAKAAYTSTYEDDEPAPADINVNNGGDGGVRLSAADAQAQRDKHAREEQSALAAKEKEKFQKRMAKKKAGGGQ